ncbi:hypothetical protein CYMTET_23726 [Cymbomonas tetramitiformis]|uniref:Cytokinin riboside 5'-monophosphate phosphoribohydrolase n=1 Tax=Cymbomonas tetramitiformis TaxID=36881 RepID=A0AAE0L0U2_9CHLO|nr:hypothetical protein CYMTET_23726 [Cymbomonas tetramitiformis]
MPGAKGATKLSNICVYCGASPGNRPEYALAAQVLGREMTKRNIGLVYGGGSVGLMGEISKTVNGEGGRVLGVIPVELQPVEVSGESVGQTILVNDMHERKAAMASAADGFIAMPGGFGTLEELMEVVTWQQLGFMQKPIGLLNIEGYYDGLLSFVDEAISAGFIRPSNRSILLHSSNPAELIDMLQAYEPAPSLISTLRQESKR